MEGESERACLGGRNSKRDCIVCIGHVTSDEGPRIGYNISPRSTQELLLRAPGLEEAPTLLSWPDEARVGRGLFSPCEWLGAPLSHCLWLRTSWGGAHHMLKKGVGAL